MQYLNFIYFIVITWYSYSFLKSSGKIVPGAFDEKKRYRYSGPELFWCLIFSTGLLALSASVGLDLAALRLGTLELLCIMGIATAKKKAVWSLPVKLYFAYLVWLVIGIVYGPTVGYGFRVFLKYIYALLICLAASAIVEDKEVFLKSSLWARRVALISIVFAFVPFIGVLVPGVFWYGTAEAINYISMIIFSLGLFYFTPRKKNIWYAVLFVVPCFLWVFRTSIMGSALAIMVFYLFKNNLKALPIIFGCFVLAVTLVFAIPSVREKMFYKSDDKNADMLYNGQLSMDDVDSNGRFAMWEWSLDKFWEPSPLTGAGTGNLQETFYALRHPFGTIKICHNDYVQILCDNGLIGIVLFGGSFLMIIFHCFKMYNTKRYPMSVRFAAITAGATLAGMMLTMYTDNVVNYSMATLSMPMGFYGMALGMERKFNQSKHGI